MMSGRREVNVEKGRARSQFSLSSISSSSSQLGLSASSLDESLDAVDNSD